MRIPKNNASKCNSVRVSSAKQIPQPLQEGPVQGKDLVAPPYPGGAQVEVAPEAGEVVHHLDGDRTNNHPESLRAFPSHKLQRFPGAARSPGRRADLKGEQSGLPAECGK